jgi:polyisoprenoid-binding protein YceI
MQAPSGQVTAAALRGLLKDGVLAGEWILDPSRSTVSLTSRTFWGLAPVKGVFRQVSGEGTVSPTGQVSGTVTVAAASIDTHNTRRDTHLRSPDFFDSDNHPHIAFTAEGVRPSGQGVVVTGAPTVSTAL